MGKGTSNYCCMRDIKYVNQNKHECNCVTPPLNVILTRNLNKNIKKKIENFDIKIKQFFFFFFLDFTMVKEFCKYLKKKKYI